MKTQLGRSAALAALMAGFAGGAYAEEGWYVRGDIGYSIDGKISSDIGDANIDDNWAEFLGAGYGFSNGVRVEAEASHRFNDIKVDPIFADGDAHAWGLMFNVFYDFMRGRAIEPYVGLGLGGVNLNASINGAGGVESIDDSTTNFAYQAMIGAAWRLNERTKLDFGYRYLKAANLDTDGAVAGVPFSFDTDYQHQTLSIGLRYQLEPPAPPPEPYVPPVMSPPPPPPPPAVTTCPASEFVVYFEWDRSDLNQAAQDTIASAVSRARQCNLSAALVVGDTDTSGSAEYNLGLSERRASVVRDALVAAGLPATAITTEGHGEADLARPTADGVREPLNRRAAVTISFR